MQDTCFQHLVRFAGIRSPRQRIPPLSLQVLISSVRVVDCVPFNSPSNLQVYIELLTLCDQKKVFQHSSPI